MDRTEVFTTQAPMPIGPYTQAIRCGQFIYTSGQIGLDPVRGELTAGDVKAQTHRALQNLEAVLKTAGSSLTSVVKTTVFLTTMQNYEDMNAIYATYFQGKDIPPARSTVAVAELPRRALVEIECVALVEE